MGPVGETQRRKGRDGTGKSPMSPIVSHARVVLASQKRQ